MQVCHESCFVTGRISVIRSIKVCLSSLKFLVKLCQAELAVVVVKL